MERVLAWGPAVPGITEVFHAHFTDHRYPSHVHETWTLLIVDQGAIRYDLDRQERGALRADVTLLPPHVPHDGRSARREGFRKRVLYLDSSVLGDDLIGAAVDRPNLADGRLRDRVHRLHLSLAHPGDELESASRLAFVQERLRAHLRPQPTVNPDPALADRLRELLDARLVAGLRMDEAATLLGAHPTHLVRSFARRFGLPPHLYLTGRRIDLARRLLLGGMPIAEVAARSGFFDQSHLTRHFRKHVGVTPGNYFTDAHSRG